MRNTRINLHRPALKGVFIFFATLGALGLSARAAEAEARKAPAGNDLFREVSIPTLQLQVSDAGMESLRNRPRRYVAATVREGNRVYTNVAVHLKGGPGSFRQVDDHPAFTLNFERFAEGQKFHGLKKIHLNNSVQDRTYLSEKISREIFEAAGVPVPRAGHAIVRFNGDAPTLYVLLEGVNKQFLKRYFKDPDGNVYDGHSQNDVNQTMRVNSGENPQDQSGLRALAAAAREPDLEKRLALFEKTLDVDRFLSFVALEVMLCHWDGYVMNRNNFRIFHDREAQRMVFMPHGMDQLLGRPDGPLVPQAQGLVARSVLEVPQLRQRYRERVAQLLTNVLQIQTITNRVVEVAGKLQAALKVSDPRLAEDFPQRALAFNRRIQRRVRGLESQLSLPKSSQSFDPAGLARITSWHPQTDSGQAVLTQERDPAGKGLLHISAPAACIASWRSRVTLDRGSYQLVGRAKTHGVVLDPKDPKAGAGLRISHHPFARRLSGDVEGELLMFDFEVDHDQSDVELVCELRATEGEVWFSAGTLCVVRK